MESMVLLNYLNFCNSLRSSKRTDRQANNSTRSKYMILYLSRSILGFRNSDHFNYVSTKMG